MIGKGLGRQEEKEEEMRRERGDVLTTASAEMTEGAKPIPNKSLAAVLEEIRSEILDLSSYLSEIKLILHGPQPEENKKGSGTEGLMEFAMETCDMAAEAKYTSRSIVNALSNTNQ